MERRIPGNDPDMQKHYPMLLTLPSRVGRGAMREPGFIKREPRVDTKYKASLIDSDGAKLTVVVIDISASGCRMETDGTLQIGERVEIEVPRYGTYPAQIRWALGNEAGAVFLTPVFLPED